jgi:FkbM family methyltransferase
MTSFYVFLYRVSFALDNLGARLSRFGMARVVLRASRLMRRLRRAALPELRLLVRVQTGLSRGMWIRVRLPEEASYWRGEREGSAQSAISAVTSPGSVVYDVGAHIGVVTLGAARLVGKTGSVVAFDPDPENVDRLRESCALNGLEGCVRVVHAAVWSRTAIEGISFQRGGRRLSHGGVVADGYRPVAASGDTIKVPSITLDDFIASRGPSPKLVKIDVEGGEYEVLRGGRKLFQDQRPLIIVEVHHRFALDQITNWLQEFRYRAKWEIPEPGFPRILFAWPEESYHSKLSFFDAYLRS